MAKRKNKSRSARRSKPNQNLQLSPNPPQRPLHPAIPGKLWSVNYELYHQLHDGDGHECRAYRAYESAILLAVEIIFADESPTGPNARPARLVTSMDDALACRWFNNIAILLAVVGVDIYRKPLIAEQVAIAVLDWLLQNRRESLEGIERDIGRVKEYIDVGIPRYYRSVKLMLQETEPEVSNGREEHWVMVPTRRNENPQNQSTTQNPIIGTLFFCVEVLLRPQTLRGRSRKVNVLISVPVLLHRRGAQKPPSWLSRAWGIICVAILLAMLYWTWGIVCVAILLATLYYMFV